MTYALKFVAAAIAFVVAGAIAVWLFSDIWFRIGIGAAIVVVCGGLLLFAWRVEKKDRAAREGLENV